MNQSETVAARIARAMAKADLLGQEVRVQAAEREEAARTAEDAAFIQKLETAGLPIPHDVRAARIAAAAAKLTAAIAEQEKARAERAAQIDAEQQAELARQAEATREAEAARQELARRKQVKLGPAAPADFGPVLPPAALAELRRATLARLLIARGVTDPAALDAALEAASGLSADWPPLLSTSPPADG